MSGDNAKAREAAGEAFVRVLDPIDPWLHPEQHPDSQRRENFRGRYTDISVAMVTRCAAPLVVASFYGARKEVGLGPTACFQFAASEVDDAGGMLADTPSNPPWPPEYSHAHHDVVSSHDKVTAHMAELYRTEPGRVQPHEEVVVLRLIAELLGRDDVDPKFKKNAAYRFKRLFEDGGAQRALWIQVAREHRHLLTNTKVLGDIRKLYQDKHRGRVEWQGLMKALQIPPDEQGQFK